MYERDLGLQETDFIRGDKGAAPRLEWIIFPTLISYQNNLIVPRNQNRIGDEQTWLRDIKFARIR